MLFWVVVIISILLSALLIIMVLLQPSKSGGIGGAFGNLGSSLSSTFGSRRTLDMLAKGTTWVAAGLGIICLLANVLLKSQGTSAGPSLNPVTTGQQAAPTTTPAVPNPGAATAPGATAPTGGQPIPVPTQPAPTQPAPATPSNP